MIPSSFLHVLISGNKLLNTYQVSDSALETYMCICNARQNGHEAYIIKSHFVSAFQYKMVTLSMFGDVKLYCTPQPFCP